MMKTDNFTATATIDNSFSWHRVGMVGIFHRSQIRRQIIIYTAIVATLFILSALPGSFFGFIQSLEATVLGFMFYLGPIAFAYSSRVTETMLPARASEKFTFYLIYSLLIIPVVIYGGWTILWVCFQWIDNVVPFWSLGKKLLTTGALEFVDKPIWWLNIFSALPPVVTALWIAVTAKSSPVLKSIVGVIGTLFAIGLISGIVGVVNALIEIDAAKIADTSSDTIAETIKDGIIYNLIYVISICSVIYATIGLTFTYRKIAHRQI